MSEERSSLEDIYLTLVKEADEQYEAEMKAISEGADLDEVFDTADKKDSSEEEKKEEEKSSEKKEDNE